MHIAKTIVCVDCGGTCHVLRNPEEEVSPGDIVPYRCCDCNDRWDIVVPEVENNGIPD